MQLGLCPRISQDIGWGLSFFTCCPCIFNSGECQLLVYCIMIIVLSVCCVVIYGMRKAVAFFIKNLEFKSLFVGPPVLDFWSRLLWVQKPEEYICFIHNILTYLRNCEN